MPFLRRILCSAVLFGLIATPVFATGPTGKISGQIVDAGTGETLPGVNVIIDGTTIGAITDLDGYYYILNVPPGTYNVKASFVGFATVSVENVKVIVDKTTNVDFSLPEEVLQGEEVVIIAESPIVQIDRTTTTSVLDKEQLAALPVTNLGEAINLQAGVVDGHFRGGRTGEVAYLVNGVPINNAFSQDASFEVEQNMVESLEVISGVFNAEYGQALSGIVNVVTKGLPSSWSGTFLGTVGAIASSREMEFLKRNVGPGTGLSADDFESEFVPFSEAATFPNQLDIQASLGGPIIKDKLGIQASVRYLDDKSFFIGRDLFAPSDSSQNLNSGLPRELWSIESTGDGDFVPLNTTNRLSINASLSYNISSKFKLDYNVFFQDGTYKSYSQSQKYVPDGINSVLFFNQTHIVGLRYAIDSQSFANLSYSYLDDKTDVRLYESPFDTRYQSSALSGLQGANAFQVGGNDLFTSDQLTQTHTIVGDYSRQVNRVHLMKTGVLVRLHNLDNYNFGIERSFRTGNLPQPSPDQFSDNLLQAKPKEFAVYIQDKMEFKGLIVNAGLRYDYFDPDYLIPNDWSQASDVTIPDPANPSVQISNRKQADIEMQVSPRLGIAFPISATGVMRFSAGLFFQIPAFSQLYANPEYEINPQSSSNTYGNAGIQPERTLSFEVGLQQGLTDDMGIELTIFSKDVRNLTGQEILRDPNGNFAVRAINRDYGTIRGVTASLFQRSNGPVSWTLDYTLQFAEGTASSPGEAFGRQQAGLENILSLVRLDWDRRHVLNNTLSISPMEGLDVTFINRLQGGTPYTTVRNFVSSTLKNNGTRPMIFGTDMRLFYKPSFLKVDTQLFVQVRNLFDTVQEVNVYSDTGRADESVQLELFRRANTAVGGLNTLDEFFYQQGNFGAPRRISLGLNYRF